MTVPRTAIALVVAAALCLAVMCRRGTDSTPVPPVTPPVSYAPRPAGTVTYSNDVEPIIQRHCRSCHRPGAAGPFALVDYADARERAAQIADVVQRGIMPPWLPDSTLISYVDQRVLTAEEIGLIGQWAREGAPPGELVEPSSVPADNDKWRLGEPELIVEMPEDFMLPAAGTDVFRNFVIPVGVAERRYVRAVEFRPLNPQVVHHGVLLVDITGESRRLDEQDAEQGFGGMLYGMSATSPDGHFLGWTPGKRPFEAPAGMGWQLSPGTDLVLQLHMLPTGKPESVNMQIGMYFTNTPPRRHPLMLRLGSLTIDLPAGATNYRIEDTFELPVDVDVLSVYPHAHYLGQQMNSTAIRPDGSRAWLLHIPQWDFNWQDEYRFAEPMPLPRGTRLAMDFSYDNSAENIRNPHHPPQRVVWGPQSTDEMGDLWVQVVAHHPADDRTLRAAFGRKEWAARLEGSFHAVAVTPESAVAHYNLGCMLEQVERLDEATRHYSEALAIDPRHVQSLNNLGVILGKRGEITAAIAQFEKAVELSPDYADARENLTQARRLLKESEP